jgi:chemotaxis family two-component system sensor kinase Cph1
MSKLTYKRKIGVKLSLIALSLTVCLLGAFIFPLRYVQAFVSGSALLALLILLWTARQIFGEIVRRDYLEVSLVEADARLESILNANFIGILFWDSHGKIIESNPAFFELFGYTMAELKQGKLGWDKLSPPTYKAKIDSILEVTNREGSSTALEVDLLSSKQKLIPVLISTAKLTENQNVAFLLNRSEQRIIELKLAEHTRAVEQSNRDLQEFAYVASHDLQEPLRMVSSFMQLLSQRYQGKLDKDADEFIEFAVDGAKRMQQLVNDLLSFARLNRTGKQFEIVDSRAVLEKSIDNLRFAIEESGAQISSATLPPVFGNPSQLGQLFSNLIGNALKFRGSSTPVIHISANSVGDDWCFRVRDNGIGIERDFLEKIFGIFQRLHGREKYAGSGIGLAICRRIVGIHGGRIWVDSDYGKGSTFQFTIPKRGENDV